MVKKCFAINEEVVDVFHENIYIPTIEKLSFYLAHIRILGSMECGNTINDFFHANASTKYIKSKEIMQKKSSKQLV